MTDTLAANPLMGDLIEKLIEEAPRDHEGAIQCQVILMNGATIMGALRKSPYGIPGFYSLRAVMRKDNPMSGPTVMNDVHFAASAVFTVIVPTPAAEQPRIVTPRMA